MKRVMLGVALVSMSASAEDVKTFLQAAEQGSVDLRISIEQRNRAAAEYRQAWTGLFPTLSASAGWTHNQYKAEFNNPLTGTTAVIVPLDQFEAAFRFEVPLIDTTRWFRASASATAEEGAVLREQAMRDAIRRQVVASYYGYAASLAVREASKRSAAVALEQLKLTEIRTNVGTVTELDLLRSKAEAARTKQTLADTEALVATSRRTVRTLTGLDPPEALPMPVDDLTPAAPLADLEARIEQLPAVQAADKDAQASGKLATASRLALVPLISAQFTERITNATSFTGQAAAYNAGINLAWRLDVPTFMGMQVQSSNEQVAQLASERSRLLARDQVNGDWQRLQAALIKVEAARAQLEAAQRATQVARDRYAVGAATQLDVITAERDVFGADVNHIQARTELSTARASLRISAALPLE